MALDPGKNKKGYTLMEMMLTVAIVAIISGMAGPLLMQMTNFWKLTSARNAIQRDVRTSLDLVNRFTRQAQSGTVVIDSAAGQPPASRVTFTDSQGQEVSFYQNGNKLYMRLGSVTSVLSSNIAYIAFTYMRSDDTSLLSVAITAQSATYRGGKKALQLSIEKVRIMN
jgi:prepilin-type N-terminal cleavage/methylation domain-containing protein